MLDKLFFIIYNAYYNDGNYKNDIPPLTVGGIFIIFFFCIGLSIHSIMLLFEGHPYLAGKSMNNTFTIAIVIAAIVCPYLLFFMNKRYHVIYERFQEDSFLNSISAKILGFSIVIFGIILPLILALVVNKIKLGRWV